MRIKDVENRVGITKKNIRFYEKEGLLYPERELENSYRDYSEDDILRLEQIKLLRKLRVPISDIRAYFSGEWTLPQVMERHSAFLLQEKQNIETAQQICTAIQTESASGELDAHRFLEEIERLEKGGTRFMNVQKQDVKKKYLGPVLSCVSIVLFYMLLGALILHANQQDPEPVGVIVFLILLLLAMIVGTILALVSRIQEIKGGEEDDLSQY